MSKNVAKFIAKVGWILVVIGFFMPISCDQNGVQIAKYMHADKKDFYAVCMILILIIAIIALIASIFIVIKNISSIHDIVLLVLDVICGLIPLFGVLSEFDMQSGAGFILAGWIVIFIGAVIGISVNKKE
ncbi:MAG: hypothetical protein K2M99_01125 [Treponemataceae bacterium]|nr:hypothetical protein [Treponemataceae bacterium]